MDKNNRIEKYINAIEQIDKGQRNDFLYRLGLSLRAEFGLTGDDLVSWLSYANQTNCNPPLSDDEVIGIARSVDKSDVPAGEATAGYNGQHGKKATKTERKKYVVDISAVSVSVDTLLSKEVSVYENCKKNEPKGKMTVGEVLESYRKPREQIEVIRREPNTEKRKELKWKLTAVVFGSEPQIIRRNYACKPNGIICLDFDNIPKEELESAKQMIAAIPYIFSVGLSASAGGLWALAHYVGTPTFETLLPALQADFRHKIDPSRKDLCGLRYTTSDKNLIIKNEVFPAILTERTEVVVESSDWNVSKKQEWDKMFDTALTAQEILATDFGELKWIVNGLIPEGLTVFAGQTKIGKSWFALQLASCTTTSKRFLNELDTNKNEVLYIALEDSPRRIKSRLQFQNLPVGKGLHVIHEWQDQWEALGYFLEKNPAIKVIVIDTWGRFISGACKDGNDYAETTALSSYLHELSKQHRAAIIVITHTRKDALSNDWVDSVMGSKALVAVADTILRLSRKRNEGEGTLSITGRDVIEQEFILEQSEDRTWKLSEKDWYQQSLDSKLTAEQREVMKTLRLHEPATLAVLKRYGRGVREMESPDEVLRQLVKLGMVYENIRDGDGLEGRNIIEFSTSPSVAVATPLKNKRFLGGIATATFKKTKNFSFFRHPF